MSSHRGSANGKVTFLVPCLAVLFIFASPYALSDEAIRAVPKAPCGSQDRTESVQGETTLAERFSSGPTKAYNCNLELVGQFEGEGTGLDMVVFANCAYYSTWPNAQVRHPGVVVLDVSDSRHPKATAFLNSPAMLDANESLAFDSTRGLLVASKYTFDSKGNGTIDIYDVSEDCRHPILKSSLSLAGMQSHSGQFTADGRTYYGANCGICSGTPAGPPHSPASAVFAIDTSDSSNLRQIAVWAPPKKEWVTHSVSVNRDATRAYVVIGWADPDVPEANPSYPNGLVILDISDIQARRPNPQFRVISTLFWNDAALAEFALPIAIGGHPYIIWTDLLGTITSQASPSSEVCDSGKPGHGFARIIDIANEKNPKTAAKLTLEVDLPANCSNVRLDPTLMFGYGSLGCDVDNDKNARLLACGYFEGGLRVFDIREPNHPREVAYYKPPARRTASRPGSIFPTFPNIFQPGPLTGASKDHTADGVIFPRFHNNGEEIWFNSLDNGFQVVRFTDEFKASHADLFRN